MLQLWNGHQCAGFGLELTPRSERRPALCSCQRSVVILVMLSSRLWMSLRRATPCSARGEAESSGL